MKTENNAPIIIFDGYCNFCDASVNFIMDSDKNKEFLFTPNQENSGKAILQEHGAATTDVDTLYLFENGILYDRSTAALRIAKRLKFPWYLSYGFIIVPRVIRDAIYNVLAKNRYNWFGKKEGRD